MKKTSTILAIKKRKKKWKIEYKIQHWSVHLEEGVGGLEMVAECRQEGDDCPHNTLRTQLV